MKKAGSPIKITKGIVYKKVEINNRLMIRELKIE